MHLKSRGRNAATFLCALVMPEFSGIVAAVSMGCIGIVKALPDLNEAK